LKFLPESIKYLDCSSANKRNDKAWTIYNSFADEQGIVETGIKNHYEYGIYYRYIKDLSQKLKSIKEKSQVQNLLEFGGNLQKLLDDAKNKLGSRSKNLLDMLLETQTNIIELDELGKSSQEQESFLQELKGSLTKKGLSKDEIEIICQKQKEAIQSERTARSLELREEDDKIISSQFQGLRLEGVDKKELEQPKLEANIEQQSSSSRK
jgi:hypothetical protein